MNKQKGEVIFAAAVVIVFAYGIFLGTQEQFYESNKAEACTEHFDDVSKNERKECYLEKQANKLGKTLTEKE